MCIRQKWDCESAWDACVHQPLMSIIMLQWYQVFPVLNLLLARGYRDNSKYHVIHSPQVDIQCCAVFGKFFWGEGGKTDVPSNVGKGGKRGS